MIEFNAGSFSGDITIEKVGTVKKDEVKVQLRVVNTDNSSTLLPNSKKICQAAFVIEGMNITTQGEMSHVGTFANGNIAIDLVISNDVSATKLFSKNKESGQVVINFSSVKGTATEPRADEQGPELDGLEDE